MIIIFNYNSTNPLVNSFGNNKTDILSNKFIHDSFIDSIFITYLI